MEGLQNKPELTFEVEQYKDGTTLYNFKGLAIAIDTTGKNYKDLPELYFGPYNNETKIGSLDQPGKPILGLDMNYVGECIKKVAEASGVHKFWFYPYSGDSPTENKEERKQARMRLFQKISQDIQPTPEGFGYVLTV